jgi:hypothetical protein
MDQQQGESDKLLISAHECKSGVAIMFTNKPLATVTIVLSLAAGLSATAFAAGPHGHEGHGASALELRLDNGRKWQTDAPLQTGMTRIRDAVEASLSPIHAGRYSADEFSALADKVQEEVNGVVANCKLSEEADIQLHVVLAQVMEGIDVMKGGDAREQGVVRLVAALDAYGEHFDHPGWQPLLH